MEAEKLAAPDLALVQRRIRDVVRVLEDFNRLRDSSHSRAEYLEQVSQRMSRAMSAWQPAGWPAAVQPPSSMSSVLCQFSKPPLCRDPATPL